MKLLPVFIAVLIGCFCFGQKKDSVSIWTATAGTNILLGDITIVGVNTAATRPDTVKILMLVCDTTKNKISTSGIYEYIDNLHFVWWQFGYEVSSYGFYLEGEFPKYFDQDKKPLPKSVVVWITKEIKQ